MEMLGGVAGGDERIGVWRVVGKGECRRRWTEHVVCSDRHWRGELYRDDEPVGLVMAGDATG